MSKVWLYTCTGTRGESTIVLTTTVYPTCNPASAGNWVEIEYVDPGVISTVIDPAIASTAFAAGFGVMATGMLIAGAIAFVIRLVRSW